MPSSPKFRRRSCKKWKIEIFRYFEAISRKGNHITWSAIRPLDICRGKRGVVFFCQSAELTKQGTGDCVEPCASHRGRRLKCRTATYQTSSHVPLASDDCAMRTPYQTPRKLDFLMVSCMFWEFVTGIRIPTWWVRYHLPDTPETLILPRVFNGLA